MALVIYPVMGHWVWGGVFFESNKPWLASLGFLDFAGSTVVHSVGAWVALVGVWVLGPRLGRYGSDGKIKEFKPYNMAYAILGVFILWFGWWGFNGGSTLAMNDAVGSIILNTNLSAAAAGLTAFLHSYLFQRKADLNEKFLGGILGGLVAITACCDVVTPLSAMIIGFAAGVVHNLAFDLILKRMKLDDPIGAIPVHGACGVFGTLCVGIFGQAHLLPHSRIMQIGVQFLGVATCFVWTASTAYVMYRILRATVGLRVPPAEERAGLNIAGELEDEHPDEEDLDNAELLALMGTTAVEETSDAHQRQEVVEV